VSTEVTSKAGEKPEITTARPNRRLRRSALAVAALGAVAAPVGFLAAPAGATVTIPTGYWVAGANGAVFTSGTASSYGSPLGVASHSVVGIASTLDGKGYWAVAADGGVFAYGDAVFYGSAGSLKLNSPIVGIAATPTGNGYWLVGQDGGVYTFGGAAFGGSYYTTYGVADPSTIVGISSSPTGGYVILSQTGAVYAFGGAKFFSSPLLQGATGQASAIQYTPDGLGYWVLQNDGGVYAFGDATGLATAVTYAIGGASNFAGTTAQGFAAVG